MRFMSFRALESFSSVDLGDNGDGGAANDTAGGRSTMCRSRSVVSRLSAAGDTMIRFGDCGVDASRSSTAPISARCLPFRLLGLTCCVRLPIVLSVEMRRLGIGAFHMQPIRRCSESFQPRASIGL